MESPSTFKDFQKKIFVTANVLPRLRIVKTFLDDSLKSAVLEHPLAVNILKGHKHLLCFSTHWLPMISILFGIVRICCSMFKRNYLKNKKLFLKFFFRLWNLHQILNTFEKKMTVIANAFRRLQTAKGLVKPLSRIRCFRTSFDSQSVNGCQTLVKSAWEHFHHIFDHSDGKLLGKYLPYWTFKS